MSHLKYHRHGWLWWSAFWILLGGGVLYYAADQQAVSAGSGKLPVFIAAGTVLLAGVCVIAATADWWLKR